MVIEDPTADMSGIQVVRNPLNERPHDKRHREQHIRKGILNDDQSVEKGE